MKYVAAVWLAALTACSSSPAQPPDAALDAPPVGAPDPAHSTMTVTPTSAVVGIDQVVVRVTLRDADGMPLSGVPIQITATGSGNTFSSASPSNADGITLSAWTTSVAETKDVTVVAGGATIGRQTVTWMPGPTAQLVFLTQPTTEIAGGPIAPTVTVAAEDRYGNFDPTVTATVAMRLDSTTVALAGTTSVTMAAGIATFPAIHVDVPGLYRVGSTSRSSTRGEPWATASGWGR